MSEIRRYWVENDNGPVVSRLADDGAFVFYTDHLAVVAENEKLRERLKTAEDVVSYLVIWGASPTNRLAELVEQSMMLRMRDKETLCIPSAVKAALKQTEGGSK